MQSKFGLFQQYSESNSFLFPFNWMEFDRFYNFLPIGKEAEIYFPHREYHAETNRLLILAKSTQIGLFLPFSSINFEPNGIPSGSKSVVKWIKKKSIQLCTDIEEKIIFNFLPK